MQEVISAALDRLGDRLAGPTGHRGRAGRAGADGLRADGRRCWSTCWTTRSSTRRPARPIERRGARGRRRAGDRRWPTTGSGFPPEDLERIFDKFYRVHRPGERRRHRAWACRSARASSRRTAAASGRRTAPAAGPSSRVALPCDQPEQAAGSEKP